MDQRSYLKTVFFLPVLAILALCLHPCPAAAGEPLGGFDAEGVRVLHSSTRGGPLGRGMMVVKAREDAEGLRTRLNLNERASAALGKVDLSREQVVAVFAGESPSSGYRVNVKGIRELDDKIEVVAVRRVPGPNCMTLSVMTHPYAIVSIPRSDKPVEVVIKDQATNCR